jgi:hypothetical protein
VEDPPPLLTLPLAGPSRRGHTPIAASLRGVRPGGVNLSAPLRNHALRDREVIFRRGHKRLTAFKFSRLSFKFFANRRDIAAEASSLTIR